VQPIITGLEREIYILRLEEADLQKVDQGLNLGPIYTIPGLAKIKEDIEHKRSTIMEIKAEIVFFEDHALSLFAKNNRLRR
jgi:hypothetical protein